jgi:hypothetical protein
MRYIIALFVLLGTVCAHAQYDISLKLPRANFMALEAITATVTITNRTGTTAVLGGPGRADWLSFEMTTSEGTAVAQMDVDGAEIVQVPAGGTVEQKIVVTKAYAPSEMGNYALKARVFHPSPVTTSRATAPASASSKSSPCGSAASAFLRA